MKHLFTAFILCVGTHAVAQPSFPPVPGNDVERKNFGLVSNPGWVLDHHGSPRPDVQFVTEGGSPRTYIRKDASMSFTVTTVDTTIGGIDTLRRLDMELIGEMAVRPDAIASSEREQWRNYYLPHCGPMGITQVESYNRIVYEGIYPNIDLWVFSGYYGQKMMFVVHPAGNPDDILMKFTGQDQLDVDVNGWLRMLLQDKWITLPEATAYQYDQNNAITPMFWTASYSASNNSGLVHFNFDTYDTTKPLVLLIGPPPPMMGGPQYDEIGLCWSTYLGDDGSDYTEDIRSDDENNLYITGRTSSTLLQFPADPGVFHATSGNTVAIITKFSALHQLRWTLFYGGDLIYSSSTGNAIAIKETPDRRIYMGGSTQAQDLWTMPNGDAYIDASNSSTTRKGFITECDDQTGELYWATYFGEHDVEILGLTVVPGTNHLVICGKAKSDLPNLQYGPPTNSLNQSYAGGWDACVALFDPDRQLYWRTWWGGTADDLALDIEADANKIVLAGHTASSGIDMMDPGNGAYAQAFGGNQDVYVIEIDINGVEHWSTYLGGPDLDHLGPKGLDIGLMGDVFLAGQSFGGLGIVAGPNWYDDVDDGNNGFIARFDGTDRSPEWITYLGTGNPHLLFAIDQGADGLINVTGWTTGEDLPHVVMAGMYDQPDIIESLYGAFVIRFKPDQELLHGTAFGGDAGTQQTCGRAMATNSDGLFVTGFTRKAVDPQTYFPLDDGQGLPWFDGEYNHLAQSVLGTDAFIAWFCQELNVGLTDPFAIAEVFPRALTGPNGLLILGLPDGILPCQLFDGTGRLIWTGPFRSYGGRSEVVQTRMFAPGIYVVHAVGTVPMRFVLN